MKPKFDSTYRVFELQPGTKLKAKLVLELLTTKWDSALVNNNFSGYIAKYEACFYLFETNTVDFDAPRCDLYGRWISTGAPKAFHIGGDSMKRFYWNYTTNTEFKRTEYRLNFSLNDKYRGLMFYKRPFYLTSD